MICNYWLISGNGECNCLTSEKYIEKYNDWCKEFENYQRAYNEWEVLRDQVRTKTIRLFPLRNAISFSLVLELSQALAMIWYVHNLRQISIRRIPNEIRWLCLSDVLFFFLLFFFCNLHRHSNWPYLLIYLISVFNNSLVSSVLASSFILVSIYLLVVNITFARVFLSCE